MTQRARKGERLKRTHLAQALQVHMWLHSLQRLEPQALIALEHWVRINRYVLDEFPSNRFSAR